MFTDQIHATSHSRTKSLAVTVLLAATASLGSGCYERVVRTSGPGFTGEMHQSNISNEDSGFWDDLTQTREVVRDQESASDFRSRARDDYKAQLKELYAPN
jgi:hypothetical protein